MAKKSKLSFDKTYGPAPCIDGKYATAASFLKMYRTFQWSEGFDTRIAKDVENVMTTLVCATHPDCPFSITALYHHFNDPIKDRDVLGQKGFRISGSETIDSLPFQPTHSHIAPFIPMDVQLENARRSTLSPDDPSLENPPLVRVQATKGFASEEEGTPMPGDVEMTNGTSHGSAAPGAGAPSGASPGGSGDLAQIRQIKQEAFERSSHVSPAYANQGSSMPTSSSSAPRPPPAGLNAGRQAGAPSQESSALPPAYQPSPPITHAPTPVSNPSHTPTPGPSTAAASSSFAAPAPPPSSVGGSPSVPVDPSLATTPLGAFLVDISPSFLEVLPDLDARGIPLSTDPQVLIDLDTDDHAIWELFQDVEGCTLMHCALASEGVRKAKERSLAQGGGGGGGGGGGSGAKLNPKIIMGLQKAQVNSWVRKKIAEGQRLGSPF
ncbi:hypothetical protein JCM3766R1_000316 [Sporobolomyces carnicolor]